MKNLVVASDEYRALTMYDVVPAGQSYAGNWVTAAIRRRGLLGRR